MQAERRKLDSIELVMRFSLQSPISTHGKGHFQTTCHSHMNLPVAVMRCGWLINQCVHATLVRYFNSLTSILRNSTLPWSPWRKKGPGSVTLLSISEPVALSQ